MSAVAAIVLAAGKSTRMKSDMPKVLHAVCGRPLLSYVLDACRLAGVDRHLVVVGYGKDSVREAFSDAADITWVEQTQQFGTGHAVQCCGPELCGFSGSIVITAGDMPLVRRSTLAGLVEARERSGDAMTMATTVLDDPTGYGRIIRSKNGLLEGVIEHLDCTAQQREITEVNPSYYCFDKDKLYGVLERVEPQQGGEYYLTDVIQILRRDGERISAPIQVPAEDAMGINSRIELANVGRIMQDRLQRTLLDEGVTIVDPDNTWIEADVVVGRDTILQPFTFIGAGADIGEGCRIGPFVHVSAGDTIPAGSTVASGAALSLGATPT